ncbi:hypothetical protein BC937DRAFT_89206 [Endogone sp. FLAS-F59071]|nr:hypothetical protein BC937DRAFT_89206 [Endogone sp. FLAS-F59071]|eukprot:RUS18036.1 hypothetical protein BC937DRAFT_89206 [Endogone sp. FLAS-F59071]
MVVSSEGYFYQYNIDLENGGECVLLKQYSRKQYRMPLGTERRIERQQHAAGLGIIAQLAAGTCAMKKLELNGYAI